VLLPLKTPTKTRNLPTSVPACYAILSEKKEFEAQNHSELVSSCFRAGHVTSSPRKHTRHTEQRRVEFCYKTPLPHPAIPPRKLADQLIPRPPLPSCQAPASQRRKARVPAPSPLLTSPMVLYYRCTYAARSYLIIVIRFRSARIVSFLADFHLLGCFVSSRISLARLLSI
jgi:hypothetical protein